MRLQQLAARWPVERSSGAYRGMSVQLVAGLDATVAVASAAGLSDGWQIARTLPHLRTALVPLPWQDGLLLRRPLPPRTWLESFRHEIGHLLCLDRPSLRVAPLWFQEGLAETMVHDGADPWPTVSNWWPRGAGSWPNAAGSAHGPGWGRLVRDACADAPEAGLLPTLQALPSEFRYSAWATLVQMLLEESDRADLWQQDWIHGPAGALVARMPADFGVAEVDAPPFLRGRDADFHSPFEPVLLASWPAQTVTLDLLHWDGSEPLRWRQRVGSSGDAVAGFSLVAGGRDARVVWRQNTFGAGVFLLHAGGSAPPHAYESRPQPARAARWRLLHLRREGQRLVFRSGEYRRVLDLGEAGLDWPLRLRLWVRGGVAEWQAVP